MSTKFGGVRVLNTNNCSKGHSKFKLHECNNKIKNNDTAEEKEFYKR